MCILHTEYLLKSSEIVQVKPVSLFRRIIVVEFQHKSCFFLHVSHRETETVTTPLVR